MKVSDCCGAAAYSNGDASTEDYGICPDCKEHCEYIDDEVCSECLGTGIREKNIPGWEGEPEQDVEVVCGWCDGTGKEPK